VQESAAVLGALGGQVDERIYPGFGHSVNEDEVAAVRELLRGMAEADRQATGSA
jgi:hypothetical protein